MNSKKVLALMMGAIIASSGMSQMAVQVYANDEESSSSSYSYDDSIGISIIDEDDLGAEQLRRLTNFTSRRVNELLDDESLQVDNLDNLYVSENNLVFEPISDTEVRLVCLDEESGFNGDIVVPARVNINDEFYSVTSIGDVAFYECENLRNVDLPDSITEIGRFAFNMCHNLQLKSLPENLNEIGTSAFAYCENLQLVVLPNGLREISYGAFSHCRNLQLEELPDGIETIGDQAFEFCERLGLIRLPEGLTRIGNNAFIACENLQLALLPEGLETIGDHAFAHCENLQLEELPWNLREIGSFAFAGCRNLQLAALPVRLTRINESTFADCENLRLEVLPDGLREIGSRAFANCINLRLEILPDGLEEIGEEAFMGCRNIQLEELPNVLEIIGGGAFADTDIRTIIIPANVTELGDSAFDTDLIERIDLAQGSRLNNDDIERAYGEQLERIQRMPEIEEHLHIGRRIIIPVEFNAEIPEDVCPICGWAFNEENGEFGRLPCGHYMHLECFEDLERNNFEQGVAFRCPLCRR